MPSPDSFSARAEALTDASLRSPENQSLREDAKFWINQAEHFGSLSTTMAAAMRRLLSGREMSIDTLDASETEPDVLPFTKEPHQAA